ncbi:3-methyladenine DNA glycosylase AlkD [Dysgonomonas sp. PFB1-18]|uniref:DNA alkylation repair protein n=1 Tax=unclassified Dysgonomonas TaxID=2630389 RepID=UPI002473A6C7|nr:MULTISPECIES: DNA alkylation repair protein [unclassified Dysgonomonas]MDH6309158.1 3-methyladenine DNA glycosylase AlkD [Dysgonomonas sp. PF1-14]MDH6338962.1 3-methyladenine DNA glycosylase AlkD [Dysgonomonas sp. PF1-16]MDH6380407.1 3-methyladenine DNA glycosylase AlkD [Dysgonomonas sp. PFB1-18]MDH6397790.1 3-methyladenine DNA glycosylase AlkD [Dysgonomonas sp. PF1-23]
MENILSDIRQALIDSADDKTKATSQNYFREEIKFYGVRVPQVNKISKEVFAVIKTGSKKDIFTLCTTLWKSGYLEESFIACNLSYYINKLYEPADFKIFDDWVNHYVSNWASCDTLCNHTVGTFIEMYPDYIPELKRWALSENRWVKRSAAVTLIIPARKGMFLSDIFDIADTLLTDKDDLVQKGYGWMLKAASERYRDEVFEYVMSKKSMMSRTSLRYAIEKMPPDMRSKAMAKP